MYYYDTAEEVVLDVPQVNLRISDAFKKVFGFKPSQDVIDEVIENDKSLFVLDDIDELSDPNTPNKDSEVKTAQDMYYYMLETLDAFHDDGTDAEVQQTICNNAGWTINFTDAMGTPHDVNLGWGPKEFEVMEELLQHILSEADEMETR